MTSEIREMAEKCSNGAKSAERQAMCEYAQPTKGQVFALIGAVYEVGAMILEALAVKGEKK